MRWCNRQPWRSGEGTAGRGLSPLVVVNPWPYSLPPDKRIGKEVRPFPLFPVGLLQFFPPVLEGSDVKEELAFYDELFVLGTPMAFGAGLMFFRGTYNPVVRVLGVHNLAVLTITPYAFKVLSRIMQQNLPARLKWHYANF